jgi:ectoine hydroxylase-related dioxygenase (phytanoyl-CoA dioxygenase family)
VIGHRRILDVIEPLLGEDCHVIANTAWRNPAGVDHTHGGGNWHIDAGPHVPLPPGVEWDPRIPHPVFAVAAHILLQDCPAACGPTGVIPGSHLSGEAPPPDRRSDPDLSWHGRGPVVLEARAGDVQLFVSDVWHRRMPTEAGDQGRYFLQVHYGRRDIAQRLRPTAEVNHLAADAVERAGDGRARTLVGLHRPFFYDG